MTRPASPLLLEARRQKEYPRGSRAPGQGSVRAAAASGCRGCRDVDAHDSRSCRQRRVPCRQGRPEDREHWRVNRRGKVHRPRIAGDEQVEPLEYGRQQHEIDVGRQLHERHITGPRRPHGVDDRLVLRRSDEHNRDVARSRASAAPTSAKRRGSHSLMRRPAAGWMPTSGAPCLGVATSSAALRRASSGMCSLEGKSTLCQRCRGWRRRRAPRAPSRSRRYERTDRGRSRR